MNKPPIGTRFAKILLGLLFAAATGSAQQDTVTLTLSSCIQTALQGGPSLTIARELFTSQRESYDSFRSLLYPQLSLQGQVPGFYRSISSVVQPDGTTKFYPQSQASSTVNLSLSQQIPFTGGELQISSGLNRVDLLETHSILYRSSPLSVTFRQPIFQLNTLRWDMENREMQIDRADRQWVEALEDISLDVTNKFFQTYLASMNVENARNNLQINDTLYQISRGRYNVGKIAENDLLQSELALLNARTQFDNATMAFENARKALAFALGLPKRTPLRLVPPESIPQLTLDPERAIAEAKSNRSDIVDMEIQKHTADRSVVQADLENTFSATLTANAGLNQRADKIPDAYRHLLDQQQLSVSFEVPLVQWGAGSSSVEAALAEQRRTETAVIMQTNALEDEVHSQVMSLKLLQFQVGISAKADTMAQRRFEVSKDRYLIGKIDVTNLFLAQNEKDSARRARIQTLWDFWAGYYRLRRLTLFDFELNSRLSFSRR
jgi:outer membrane protein TolC